MANILDYVEWRGDLSFSKSKFNSVDAVVFSQIVFLDLKGIVPARGKLTLENCANKFFAKVGKNTPIGLIIPVKINDLFSLMAKSNRYSKVLLSNYKEDIENESETQFSAITVDIEEVDIKIVVFSGTDDTVIGWKESLNMIYKTPTSSQIESVKYLNKVASGFDGKIIVLGHSKGGNLSIYSSANCKADIRKNIKRIYNLDGPGIPNCYEAERIYSTIEKKLVTIVPQASIIGRLFEQNDDHFIVHSIADGVDQHDVLTWQVKGKELVVDTDFLPDAVGVGDHIRATLNGLTVEGREAFVDALFTLLFSTGAKTLTDLSKKVPNLFSQYFKLSKEQRKSLNAPLIKFLANKYIRKCIFDSSKSFNKRQQKEKEKEKEKEKINKIKNKKPLN